MITRQRKPICRRRSRYPGEIRFLPFEMTTDCIDENIECGLGMKAAGLPEPDPFAVNPVAVAYEDSLPVLDEALECLHGPIGVIHEKRRSNLP